MSDAVKRTGAGILAAGAAVSPVVSPTTQAGNVPTNNTPAIYRRVDADFKTSEQRVSDSLNQQGLKIANAKDLPSLGQQNEKRSFSELADTMRNAAEARAEAARRQSDSKKTGELINTLKGPGYADHTDLPKGNKGIAAYKGKAEAMQSQSNSTQTSQSFNKGISDYHSKASGQSTATSNANSSGLSKRMSASTGSSNGGQSSGSSGQGR